MARRLLPRRIGSEETAELADHLGELRHRLALCLVAFVPAFAAAFALHGRLIELLTRPLPADKRLVTLGVTEPFTTSVKVSLCAAVALVLPVILWQLWAFLAPAASGQTRATIGAFAALATTLFALGVVFAYVVVLPKALAFLVGFDDRLYEVQIRASYYYGFVSLTLLAVGLAFQLPIAVLALTRLGVLTSRTLRRNRRTAYVVLVACAILLPTVDPVSLAFEVVPLLLLFELSVVLAALFERRWHTMPIADGAGSAP
jgi:sec-independent protein translocase protein TatC